jgi:RNA polymerase sigma-70 factor (ECF subfamily)
VEAELRQVPEPFRTAVILRDLEEMSYDEIAEITEVSLGTVKSRLTRGREALKERLVPFIREAGAQWGLRTSPEGIPKKGPQGTKGGRQVEVMS